MRRATRCCLLLVAGSVTRRVQVLSRSLEYVQVIEERSGAIGLWTYTLCCTSGHRSYLPIRIQLYGKELACGKLLELCKATGAVAVGAA